MDLESHCGGDETVVFFIVNVVHLEGTPIFDVSVAAQFNAVDLVSECEGGVLENDACSEFTIKEADFGVVVLWPCRCKFDGGEDLTGEKISIRTVTIKLHEVIKHLRRVSRRF